VNPQGEHALQKVLPCVGLCAYAQRHISLVGKQQCATHY